MSDQSSRQKDTVKHENKLFTEQKSLFSAIFEEAGLGMLLGDQSGHTLRTNRTLQEWLGYSADELQSMTFDQFTFPEDIANDYVLFKELAQGKRTRYQVETRCIRKNGDVVWGRATVSLVHPLEGDPVLVFRIIEDIEQRKKIQQAFQANEARNRAIFEQADIGIMVVDIEGKLLESNPAFQAMLKYTGDELNQFTIDDFTHPDDLADDREQFKDLVQNRRDHYQIEQRLRRKDDSFIWVKTTISIIQGNREHPQFAVRVVENITLRKQVEEAFRKAYRAYRMLSQGNRILVRAENQIQLLQDVCRIVVESDEYVMAWVGFAVRDESQSVYPAAYAGHESGYLSGGAITWADTERGRGPTGAAIRTGQTCIAQHIATNPAFEPWRAEALQRGYASSIALPLLAGNKAFGVLNIYAPEPDAFIPDEIVLLEELANDLAFGIMALHTRELHNQAARDLQASETRYKYIVETALDAIISTDSTGHIISWNPAAETIFGYSAEEVVSKSVALIMPERFQQAHQAGMQRFLSTRQPLNIDTTVEVAGLRKDGSEFPLELTLAYWEAGEETFFTFIIRDITERKRVEKALANERNLLRTLIDNLPDHIYVKDLQGRFIIRNEAGARHMGAASTDEVIGKTDFDYYSPELAEQYHADDMTVIQSSQPLLYQEEPITAADGTQGWILTSKVPLRDEEGNVIGLVGIGRDITERKRAEEALQASEKKYRDIVETAQEGIWIIDVENRTTFVNQRMAEMLGYTVDEMLDQSLFAFMDDEGKAQAEANVERRRQGIQEQHEFVFHCKDGSTLWTLLSTNPIFDQQGQYRGAQALVTDITDLKQAQQAEHQQRRLAEALVDTANALISALNLDTVMNTILEGIARVVPHDAANIMLIEGDLARPVYWRGYRPEFVPFVQDFRISVTATPNIRHMVETGSSFLASYTDQYTDWISQPLTEWVKSYAAAPMRSHGNVIGFLNLDSGTPGFFNAQHVQRLQAFADQASLAIEHAQLYEKIRGHAAELERRVEERTAQLNQTLKRIEAILNSSDDIIVLCRPDGKINQVNPAFDKTFKCKPDEALFQPLTNLVLSEQIPLLEQAFQEVITTFQPQRLEITVHCEGHATFDADVVLSPVIGQTDQLSGVICSLRDMTQRKQMEDQLRQMLEHEMELSELKSRYVSMAAHDLRNPLAVIQSAVNLIQQYGDQLTSEKIEEKYDRIKTSIEAMVDMLDDILTLGRVESGKLAFNPVSLDVVTFCHNIAMEISQMAGTVTPIVFSSQGDCSSVLIDDNLLRHILGNLLSNAIKYSPHDRPVTFTLNCEPEKITFCVQDQGIGIPEDDQKRLFETFYRASNARQIPGTGLGLAIIKQSVELHGGTISFESAEGHGTTFTVIIPQIPPERSREENSGQ